PTKRKVPPHQPLRDDRQARPGIKLVVPEPGHAPGSPAPDQCPIDFHRIVVLKSHGPFLDRDDPLLSLHHDPRRGHPDSDPRLPEVTPRGLRWTGDDRPDQHQEYEQDQYEQRPWHGEPSWLTT